MNINFSKKSFIYLVPYLWMVCFLLFPFIMVILISFSDAKEAIPPYQLFIHSSEKIFGFIPKPNFSNYTIFLKDDIYLSACLESLKIAFISTIIILLISYPLALGIMKAKARLRSFLLIMVALPFWTSLIIRVYAIINILKENGLVYDTLNFFYINPRNIQLLNNEFGVIFGVVYVYLPFMILPIYASLEKINPKLEEAAKDLGAKPIEVFTKIIFPLSIPGVISGVMLVFVPILGEFVIPDLLGGSKVMTIGKIIWNEFFFNRDWPMASSITVMLLLFLTIPVFISQKLLTKFNYE